MRPASLQPRITSLASPAQDRLPDHSKPIRNFPNIIACLVILFLLAGTGCTLKPAPVRFRSYHDLSMGWKSNVPDGWISCAVPGGQFSRDLLLHDPTNLILWTSPGKPVGEVRDYLEDTGGVIEQLPTGKVMTDALEWELYQGKARSDPDLAVQFGIASDGFGTHFVLLVARRAEVDDLSQSVLLPVIESFVPGPPVAAGAVLSASPAAPDYWPTDGWREASPTEQGMDRRKLVDLVDFIRREKLPIESVTVIRHGYLVMDEYFPPFSEGEIHELHSATKSVTSALVGIALEDAQARGEQVSIETPVLELLSPWQAANLDNRKRAMQLQHLLSMTAGLEWMEWGAAYAAGTGNDLVDMIQFAPDWTQYVLDRPMVAEPGTQFLYNSGASYLLSTVVSRLTGVSAEVFAASRLFGPLGITEYDWEAGPNGITTGWGNLRLQPTDLAKIGFLYLHQGEWDGVQIVPAEWVRASTTDSALDPGIDYGYQWWLDVSGGSAIMSGRFGQTVIVNPKQDLVIVITANLPDTVSAATSTPRWLALKFIQSAVK